MKSRHHNKQKRNWRKLTEWLGPADLFNAQDVLDECGSLQEGLLIRHQREEEEDKVISGRKTFCDTFRLRGVKTQSLQILPNHHLFGKAPGSK